LISEIEKGFAAYSNGEVVVPPVGELHFNSPPGDVHMCDGEVARIQNKTSIEGQYFDRLGHYIFACCLGLGLALGLSRLYQSGIYLILGFLFTLVLVIENAKGDLLRSFLSEHFRKKFSDYMYKGKSWEQNNIVTRLIGIYPFQGLIYSDTFIITPILVTLAIIECILSTSTGFPSFIIGLIPMYIVIISVVKIINISIFIIKLKRKSYITKLTEKK